MKSYVITITDLEQSVECAQRCIKSAKDKSNIDVEIFKAITPKDDPIGIAKKKQMNLEHFKHDVGSRFENVVAAFLSHYTLWEMCANGKEEFLIFEHDAVVIDQIPKWNPYQGCLNLGAPSYGRHQQPFQLGVIPLTSKRYFPGAHAYKLKPQAARILVETAQFYARPTDIFLSVDTFPWLEEFYPWPAVAKDTFTTIQNETGCLAKHNYKEGEYDFVTVK
jgi:GR25 family glycosyltransferase involved in LPS biosynthesis